MSEKVFLSIWMCKALKRQATIAAALLGIPRSELVRRAIQEYINKVTKELASAKEET